MNPGGATLPAVCEWLLLLAGAILWLGRLRPRRWILTRDGAPAHDWSSADLSLFACAVLAGMFSGQALAGLIPETWMPGGGAWSTAVQGAFFEGGMLLGVLVFHFLPRMPDPAGAAPVMPPPAPPGDPAPPECARPGAAAAAGARWFLLSLPPVMALMLGGKAVLEALGLPVVQQDMVLVFLSGGDAAAIALLALLAVLGAAITEEVVFRWGLYRAARRWLRPGAAALLTSLVFAAFHGNWLSLLPLWLLGLMLCRGYRETGSLLTPVVTHALFNLNSVLLLLSC